MKSTNRQLWLIYKQEDVKKNQWYIEEYLRIGKELELKVELILIEELIFGIKDNTWFVGKKGKLEEPPEFAIIRTIYPLLSRHLEQMGVRVFNSSKISEICNDKARTYQYIAKLQIPMVDTLFVKNSMVAQYRRKYPAQYVIKAVDGHGGGQVFCVKEKEDFPVFERIGCSDTVFQPLIGTKHQDLRVYVLGKRILAGILRTAREGFKSNFSLGGMVQTYSLSEQETKLVQKIIDQFEFGLVGIDFLIGESGELIFNEIEDVVGARMLYQCTKIDLVREYLTFLISL